MCGIAGVYLRDPNAKADLDGLLTTMLDEIEHRGGDATGFVAMGDEGMLEWQKAACGADSFSRERRSVPEGTRTILAHTRWATQGDPGFIENNHPLRRGSFFVIHNGHINNDHKLFELAGRERYGRVDSEAIPARFASFGKLAAAPKVMAELEGAAAIAVVDENAPKELVLARGSSSPLFVLTTKKYVLWGSTHTTVKNAYENHIGRLPKKARIKAMAEGTVLHFVDGRMTRRSFKVYSPPKMAKKWKWDRGSLLLATNPEMSLPKEENDPIKMSDWEACDACGIAHHFSELGWKMLDNEVEYLCDDCAELWVATYGEDKPSPSSIHDAIDAEWAAVNKAILDEDAE